MGHDPVAFRQQYEEARAQREATQRTALEARPKRNLLQPLPDTRAQDDKFRELQQRQELRGPSTPIEQARARVREIFDELEDLEQERQELLRVHNRKVAVVKAERSALVGAHARCSKSDTRSFHQRMEDDEIGFTISLRHGVHCQCAGPSPTPVLTRDGERPGNPAASDKADHKGRFIG